MESTADTNQMHHPPPTAAPTVVQLIILGRRLFHLAEQRLGRHGYNYTQALVILALHHHPGMTGQDLVRPIWVEPSSVTRALQALERRGLVTRQPHPTDGRASLFNVTDRGREAATLILSVVEATGAMVEQGIPPDDILSLRRALPAWFEQLEALRACADLESEEGDQPR